MNKREAAIVSAFTGYLLDVEIDELIIAEKRIRQLESLLRVAKCPNSDCIDGAIPHGPYPDGNWEAEQCQWCYEKEALLEDEKDE
jgi:hypothetical protein